VRVQDVREIREACLSVLVPAKMELIASDSSALLDLSMQQVSIHIHSMLSWASAWLQAPRILEYAFLRVASCLSTAMSRNVTSSSPHV
jgi:hypothetical protein